MSTEEEVRIKSVRNIRCLTCFQNGLSVDEEVERVVLWEIDSLSNDEFELVSAKILWNQESNSSDKGHLLLFVEVWKF